MSQTKRQKTEADNPFESLKDTLKVGSQEYSFFNLQRLNDPRVAKLPYSIRILLESAIRNADGVNLTKDNVNTILDWKNTSQKSAEIQFVLSRVILQDFTGVPSVVDLAAMRAAMARLGGDPAKISPAVPVDLVIDHSVQVDSFGSQKSLKINLDTEFDRNRERFTFLKWGANAFDTLQCLPPGMGIVHQINIEYLARVVFEQNKSLYFDTLVGTDSHTPMVNGLGVLGWGVGGIEAEAAMLGQPISIVLPKVVGVKLTGSLPTGATATDLVLAVVRTLRSHGVVEKFVEFTGPGVAELSVADRATISNMAPEYGATCGLFPVDNKALDYLRMTARSDEHVARIEAFYRAQGMFRDYTDASQEPEYSEHVAIDLSTIQPALAGPKRPEDWVSLKDMKAEFLKSLQAPVGFKGFDVPKADATAQFTYEGKQYTLRHGSVTIAAITSCTNTSNPNVLIAAGLLAKKAHAKGLSVAPYVKTSLAPGSGVVTKYLAKSGLDKDLEALRFFTVGYGCTTCIGNSGPLPKEVADAIEASDLIACGVLSGNRNFEGRIHPHVRANYLASPPLVVLYALAGRVDIDFDTEPVGTDSGGKAVFMRDIWPSRAEIDEYVQKYVAKEMFSETYATVTKGTEQWNSLKAPNNQLYDWDAKSTYIHHPPFFQTMTRDLSPIEDINNAYCLGFFGDSITTDHISPAGNISKKSPAARYLMERGVQPEQFNSYGSRRGNDEVMARGTFANIRLRNNLVGKAGPKTKHVPSGDIMDVFDAAERYSTEQKTPLVIVGGKNYGSGSSRDWASKGVALQGVRAVIVETFERIHRSNLVLFGVLPLQFKDGENAESFELTGEEQYTIKLNGGNLKPRQLISVTTSTGKSFEVVARIDSQTELSYYRNGGVLQFVIRKQLAN